jgi:GDSL-like Lipase/Acylhydrolase family
VRQTRAGAVLAAGILVVTACQTAVAPDPQATGTPVPRVEASAATPAATPAPTAAPTPRRTADLVLMGDSVLLQPGPSIRGRLQDELGVTLILYGWVNPDLAKYDAGGERSADLLARLRTDDRLRADLRDAEVIVFDVPFGVINDRCPDPAAPAAEVEACFAWVVPRYRADVDAIFGELVALRDPADAIIRVTDVWQFLWPTFDRAGTYDVVRPAWQAMNQAVADAAARYGIPLVRAYDLFTGPDGDRDPVAAGDVASDEFHMTASGVKRFVDALAALGFEATAPPGAADTSDRTAPAPGT